MKKFILIGALSLLLSGCITAQDLATDITTSTQAVSQKVKAAQGYAVTLCGYLPVAASVIGIFNSGYSSSVSAVGTAICNAVTSIPLADGPGDGKARVNGVVIKGTFVK